MAESLLCFRCGASLEQLSLPLSRRDECPECSIHLHVCRMCSYFDRDAVKQCREDDAEEVYEKEKVNFCEWFKPSTAAFDPATADSAAKAQEELASLFGETGKAAADSDPVADQAEDLFK